MMVRDFYSEAEISNFEKKWLSVANLKARNEAARHK